MTYSCPVCGQGNPEGALSCSRCKTVFVAKGAVSAPPSLPVEEVKVDVSDPETKKALEELTMIPGISRAGALALYKRGIRSIEEFTTCVFGGDEKGERTGRMIANRLILAHAKMRGERARLVRCPACGSPVPATEKECGVCGSAVLATVTQEDAMKIGMRVSEALEEMLGEVAGDPEIAALPDEMKAQIAAVLASDAEVSDDDARAVAASIAELPEEFSEVLDDLVGVEKAPQTAQEEKVPAPKHERRRAILLQRIEKWRKMGFDVSELEPLVDGDFEVFKAKAKAVLSRAPSPTHEQHQGSKEIEAYKRQIAAWRSKGFDVEGLEELLAKDVEEFKRRARELLTDKGARKQVT
ncbi:MAG: hypothetical protein AB1665_03860 [Candidatus Thermoplasmatota archaeon]